MIEQMIDVSRQLKPAPPSFEKTVSQYARTRIHVEKDGRGNLTPRLNRKGRRKAEALARRAERQAFRRATKA